MVTPRALEGHLGTRALKALDTWTLGTRVALEVLGQLKGAEGTQAL